jgi:cyclic-di-GMP-binding protein
MPSFDIKSEIDKHELTNVVDQANRVLKNRFDFKDADAEFKLNDDSILLTAKEDFHIKQMSSVLQEAITKRKMDIRILKPGKIEVSNNTARQTVELQEGIDRELAKNITTLIKQSKIKVQAAIQGESVRVTGKKRDELQQTIQLITDKKYTIPIQFDNFRD